MNKLRFFCSRIFIICRDSKLSFQRVELCFLKTTSGLKISLPVLNDGYSECRKYLDNPKYFTMAPYPHLIGTWSYTLLPGFMLLTKSRTVHAHIRPTVFLFCLFRIRNFFVQWRPWKILWKHFFLTGKQKKPWRRGVTFRKRSLSLPFAC